MKINVVYILSDFSTEIYLAFGVANWKKMNIFNINQMDLQNTHIIIAFQMGKMYESIQLNLSESISDRVA